MPEHSENGIRFQGETTGTQQPFFAISTSENGNLGIIKANKEGLKLYALELLKKANEMNDTSFAKEVFQFEMIKPISGVPPQPRALPLENISKSATWLPSLIILSGGLIMLTAAAIKWLN